MRFGPHEITAAVFLIVFALLMPISVYLWLKFIRIGYPWKYGFYGATLLCVCRVGAFIAELVYYGSKYQNISAYTAYIVMLSIGYIGLIDCESALFIYWLERHFDISPLERNITGKLRLLNVAGIILIVVGSTKTSDTEKSQGQDLIRAALIIFLVLTVLQGAYLALGWFRHGRFSRVLMALVVVMCALLCRIVFAVAQSYNSGLSIRSMSDAKVKYLIGPFLIPEMVALVLLLGIGVSFVRSPNFGRFGADSSEHEQEVK